MFGPPSRRDTWALGATVALASAIRLATLGAQSYSTDEAATLAVLRQPLDGLFNAVKVRESTPPLYYLLARGWSELAGLGEFGLRSMSAIAGIGTVAIVFLTARRSGGIAAGLLGGVLASVSPLLVWYSQEARSYALLAFFGALSFHLAVVAVEERDRTPHRRRALVWWTAAGVLALCTHYFSVLFLVPEAVWIIVRCRWRALVPSAVLAATSLALLPLALAQRSTGHTGWISGSPLHKRLELIPEQFATGLSSPTQLPLAMVFALAVAMLAALVFGRRAERSEALAVATATVLGAMLTLAVLAVLGIDLALTRNALGVLPIAFVALGAALALALKGRSPAVALALLASVAIAAVSVVSLSAMLTDPHYQRPDWRAAAGVVNSPSAPHVLVVVPGINLLPLRLYVDRSAQPRSAAIKTSEIDVVIFLLTINGVPRSPTAVPVPRGFQRLPPLRWPDIEVTRLVAPSPVRINLRRLGVGGTVSVIRAR